MGEEEFVLLIAMAVVAYLLYPYFQNHPGIPTAFVDEPPRF